MKTISSMPKEEPLVILGTTTEVLLNARFRVTLPNGQKVLTHITRTIVSDHSDRTPTLVAGCVPTGGEEEKEVPCLVSLRRLPHLEMPACERIPYRAWLRASTTMKTGVLALARRRTKNDCSRLNASEWIFRTWKPYPAKTISAYAKPTCTRNRTAPGRLRGFQRARY